MVCESERDGFINMKKKVICILIAVCALFLFYGCTEQTEANPSSTVPQELAQQEEKTEQLDDSAEPEETKEQESKETAAGESAEGTESATTPQSQEEVNFLYEESYQGDGYSFQYPKDTQIISDEETTKSFLFPGGEYVLNVTRINLSGQDISVEEALPVYRKTLEEKGNSVGEVEMLEEFEFENALIEVQVKNGNVQTNSAQVFFLADGYHYTFTISSEKAEMQSLKKMVGEIVKTFAMI